MEKGRESSSRHSTSSHWRDVSGGGLPAPRNACAQTLSGSSLLGRHEALLFEVGQQLLGRLLGGLALRVADELRVLRGLVGIGDAGEFFDLAGEGFGVETLDVAL